MAEYTLKVNPHDIFVKEGAIEYSTAVVDYTESFSKFNTVDLLLQNYSFKDVLEQIEIIHFIFNNWFLMPILEECPAQSSALFGKNTNLVLELFNDPEDETDTTELFIVIKPDLSLDESLEKFDQLLADWFNTVQHKTQGVLNITIESKDEF